MTDSEMVIFKAIKRLRELRHKYADGKAFTAEEQTEFSELNLRFNPLDVTGILIRMVENEGSELIIAKDIIGSLSQSLHELESKLHEEKK